MSHPGFELCMLIPFPRIITITLSMLRLVHAIHWYHSLKSTKFEGHLSKGQRVRWPKSCNKDNKDKEILFW